ncbi:MAG: PKD domain-containing protein [Nitrosomonadales bacterium]|nr:PKD domain-containing protein [Nitrosomonadales bacterium]
MTDILVTLTPSRTAGVAPLAVFFDASATTGLTGDDFLSANFSWDFDDASAGVWQTTGKSRNRATGFLAAHVFETPGTYVVSVSVRDRAGRLGPVGTVSITVSDPAAVYAGNATRCVSRTGDFTDAPANCATLTSTDLAAQLSWLNAAANRRLLLRSGETWPGVSLALSGSGPNTLGAFGPGARPILQLGANPGQSAGLLVSGTDWRVMDLDLDGTNLPPANTEGATVVGSTGTEFLGMNLSIHNGNEVGWGVGGDRSYLYNSQVQNNAYFSVYVDGVDSALMGSSVDQMRIAVSFIRPSESRNVYITDNLIDASRAAPTTGIKWHSRRGVITDNIITAGTSRIATSASDVECDFSLAVDRNLGMLLIERNILKPDGNPANDDYISTGIDLTENDAMVRNNLIYDMNLAFRGACGASNVHVLNNSVYMTPNTTGLNIGNGDFLNIELPAVSNWEVRNNLMWSENPGINGLGELINLGATTGIALSNNLYYKPSKANPFAVGPSGLPTARYDLSGWQALGLDSHSLLADPQLVSANPASADFFRLGASSPAIGAGTPVAVFEDFYRTPRPSADGYDIGAINFR